MADDTTAVADAQAAEATDAQEAQTTPAQAAGDGEQTVSAEDARKLRSESAALRKRLKDAEAKLSEQEKKDLTELDRATREKDDAVGKASKLESEIRELRVQVLAPEAGIQPKAARAAYALIDWDDIGDPDDRKQVIRALKEVAKEHPYLTGGQSADGGAGRNGETGGVESMSDLIRQRVGKAS
jgi:hypothetical protein